MRMRQPTSQSSRRRGRRREEAISSIVRSKAARSNDTPTVDTERATKVRRLLRLADRSLDAAVALHVRHDSRSQHVDYGRLIADTSKSAAINEAVPFACNTNNL